VVSAPACTTGFANVPSSLASHSNTLSTICNSLCSNPSCSTNVSALKTGSRCLMINSTVKSDLSELRHHNEGICVFVNTTGSLTKPLRLGSGNDCVRVALGGSVQDVDTGAGDDYVYVNGTARDINTGAGADVLDVTGSARDISTGSGDDAAGVVGTTATARDVRLGDGSDYFLLTGTVNSLSLGSGSDHANVTGTVIDKLNLGSGSDDANLAGAKIGHLVTGPGSDLVGTNSSTKINDLDDDDDDGKRDVESNDDDDDAFCTGR